jgi:hypothetical protein
MTVKTLALMPLLLQGSAPIDSLCGIYLVARIIRARAWAGSRMED